MANVLHLMGNASELDKLIQSFGKSIMIKKISVLNFPFLNKLYCSTVWLLINLVPFVSNVFNDP